MLFLPPKVLIKLINFSDGLAVSRNANLPFCQPIIKIKEKAQKGTNQFERMGDTFARLKLWKLGDF